MKPEERAGGINFDSVEALLESLASEFSQRKHYTQWLSNSSSWFLPSGHVVRKYTSFFEYMKDNDCKNTSPLIGWSRHCLGALFPLVHGESKATITSRLVTARSASCKSRQADEAERIMVYMETTSADLRPLKFTVTLVTKAQNAASLQPVLFSLNEVFFSLLANPCLLYFLL